MRNLILCLSVFGLFGLAGCTDRAEDTAGLGTEQEIEETSPSLEQDAGDEGIAGEQDTLGQEGVRQPASEGTDALTREQCEGLTPDAETEEEQTLYQRCAEAGLL